MAPKNTLRLRKRTDEGVSRVRQPSAAQAKAAQMLGTQAGRHTARFATEGSPVQLRTALSTGDRMGRIGNLPVKFQQQLVKPGIPQDLLYRLLHVLAPSW
jgi:hypothetical protein